MRWFALLISSWAIAGNHDSPPGRAVSDAGQGYQIISRFWPPGSDEIGLSESANHADKRMSSFRLEPIFEGSDLFRIRSTRSQQCFTDALTFAPCQAAWGEAFRRYPDGTIRSTRTGKCLDVVPHENARRGTARPLHFADCHGGENQRWSIHPVGQTRPLPPPTPPTTYSLVGSDGTRELCLDEHPAHREQGTVYMIPCHRGDNQQLVLDPAGGGNFRIYSRLDGRCLSAQRGAIRFVRCDPNDLNQHFRRGPDGSIRKLKTGPAYHSDVCLDVFPGEAGKFLGGQRLHLVACHGGINQRFAFRDSSGRELPFRNEQIQSRLAELGHGPDSADKRRERRLLTEAMEVTPAGPPPHMRDFTYRERQATDRSQSPVAEWVRYRAAHAARARGREVMARLTPQQRAEIESGKREAMERYKREGMQGEHRERFVNLEKWFQVEVEAENDGTLKYVLAAKPELERLQARQSVMAGTEFLSGHGPRWNADRPGMPLTPDESLAWWIVYGEAAPDSLATFRMANHSLRPAFSVGDVLTVAVPVAKLPSALAFARGLLTRNAAKIAIRATATGAGAGTVVGAAKQLAKIEDAKRLNRPEVPQFSVGQLATDTAQGAVVGLGLSVLPGKGAKLAVGAGAVHSGYTAAKDFSADNPYQGTVNAAVAALGGFSLRGGIPFERPGIRPAGGKGNAPGNASPPSAPPPPSVPPPTGYWVQSPRPPSSTDVFAPAARPPLAAGIGLGGSTRPPSGGGGGTALAVAPPKVGTANRIVPEIRNSHVGSPPVASAKPQPPAPPVPATAPALMPIPVTVPVPHAVAVAASTAGPASSQVAAAAPATTREPFLSALGGSPVAHDILDRVEPATQTEREKQTREQDERLGQSCRDIKPDRGYVDLWDVKFEPGPPGRYRSHPRSITVPRNPTRLQATVMADIDRMILEAHDAVRGANGNEPAPLDIAVCRSRLPVVGRQSAAWERRRRWMVEHGLGFLAGFGDDGRQTCPGMTLLRSTMTRAIPRPDGPQRNQNLDGAVSDEWVNRPYNANPACNGQRPAGAGHGLSAQFGFSNAIASGNLYPANDVAGRHQPSKILGGHVTRMHQLESKLAATPRPAWLDRLCLLTRYVYPETPPHAAWAAGRNPLAQPVAIEVFLIDPGEKTGKAKPQVRVDRFRFNNVEPACR